MPLRSVQAPQGNEKSDPQARIDAELATMDQEFLRKLNANIEFLIGQLGEGGLEDLIGTGNVNPNQQLLDMLQSNPAENLFGAQNLGQTAGGPFTVNLGGSPFPIDQTGQILFNAGLLMKKLNDPQTRKVIGGISDFLFPDLSKIPGPKKRPAPAPKPEERSLTRDT